MKLADGSSAVSQKYSVKHTATVAAPAVSGHISSQSPISHFLDEKDPVPKLGGGFNGVSSDRHEYRYDYRRPEEAAEDSDSGPLDFLSHDYGHNVEGIRSTESDPHGELSDEDRLNLDELEALLRGSASVTAYDTGWEPVP
ncbi:hypothetical protein [Nesterenkonia sp. NBAIMH1]|uniref:hypothetical protein n=1 Tax=Nesterenkonia sp. NBAIMH1 TaxID=2600320 RepID=UPI0011B66060|nr:hypothetical protein [Nesterenkonia sp. NBAIMH1]